MDEDKYYDGYGPFSEAGILEKDIDEVLHFWSSEDDDGWDGESVMIVARLTDGRWVYIEGSCDYTGWDCQAGAEAFYASSEAELVKDELTVEARNAFGYPPL